MGNKRTKQLIILIGLFSISILFVYFYKKQVDSLGKPSLQGALASINGIVAVRNIKIEEDVYSFLDLDDYVFADYIINNRKVNLFIGFYYTVDKVSAAHSPLVCFPGQGWTISEHSSQRVNVGTDEILYAEIIATLDGQNDLVLYWFQAGKKTTPQVYKNKINSMVNKVLQNDQQHAFVRITVPLGESSYDKAKQTALDFLNIFYPKFLEFIEAEAILST